MAEVEIIEDEWVHDRVSRGGRDDALEPHPDGEPRLEIAVAGDLVTGIDPDFVESRICETNAVSERKLKSKPMTSEEAKATARRVEAALGRHGRGEPLTEHEWTIVQYALGGGCHACGASPGVRVVVSGDSEMGSGRGRRA